MVRRLTSHFTTAALGLALVLSLTACRSRPGSSAPAAAPAARPSILLVTLDTTRADAIGPEAVGIQTPGFNAVAARGLRFRQAYATVPETLPSHVSMMTGLYPAGHGVHENARSLAASQPLVAERLQQAGYRTAAFVSSFILARRFGLARGFDTYDDALPAGLVERSSTDTTDAALAYLNANHAPPPGAAGVGGRPLFLWVHYFDPHAPYTPPEPYRSQFAGQPYLGEVAAMDAADRRASSRPSSSGRQAPLPSSSSAITAKVSATTARRSTATSSTSPRCTCRSSWPVPASSAGLGRPAGEHAAHLRHASRLGGSRRPPAACAGRNERSFSARR